MRWEDVLLLLRGQWYGLSEMHDLCSCNAYPISSPHRHRYPRGYPKMLYETPTYRRDAFGESRIIVEMLSSQTPQSQNSDRLPLIP